MSYGTPRPWMQPPPPPRQSFTPSDEDLAREMGIDIAEEPTIASMRAERDGAIEIAKKFMDHIDRLVDRVNKLRSQRNQWAFVAAMAFVIIACMIAGAMK